MMSKKGHKAALCGLGVLFLLFLNPFTITGQEKGWLPGDSVSRQKAIRLIEKHLDYHFFFNSRVINGREKVLLKAYQDIDELVFQLISGADLSYQIKEKTIILFQTPDEDAAVEKLRSADLQAMAKFKVLSGVTREPLVGAFVHVKGKNIGGIAGFDGMVTVNYYPEAGHSVFQVSYLGYKTLDTLIESTFELAESIAVVLSPLTIELSEVIVSANVQKRLMEVNAQKNAINQIQILEGDTKERLPDQNTGEALQRMSGATITRSYGEGNAIAFRGTPISYSTIQYNGENLPTTEIEGIRQVNLAGIGVDQIERIQVTKTITPDMDGDAIGGSVNLIPTLSRSNKLAVKSELGSGYNNLSGGYNLTGMVQLSKRFYTSMRFPEGRLGVKLGGNLYRTDNGRDRIEIDWDDLQLPDNESQFLIDNYNLRDLQNRRSRSGYNASFDYKYGTDNNVFLHFMHNNLTDKDIRNRIRYRASRGTYISEDRVSKATVERDVRDRSKTRKSTSFHIGNQLHVKDWKLDAAFFYTQTDRSDGSVSATFLTEDIDLQAIEVNSDFPLFVGVSEDLNDPTLYGLESIRPQDFRRVAGENMALRFDAKKLIRTFLGKATLKAGFKHRQVKHSKERWVSLYENDAAQPLQFSEVSVRVEDDDFMRGNIPFNQRIHTGKLKDYFYNNPKEFIWDENRSLRIRSEFFSKAKERIAAFYISTEFNIKSWDVLAGIRVEHNNAEYSGNEVLVNQNDSVNSLITQIRKTNYTIPLPNLQVKYAINAKSLARLGLTFGYSRPDYNTITPSRIVNVADMEIFLGNPDLKPVRSTNFDIAYEYYLGDIGVVSVTGFYKRITDFAYRTNTDVIGNEWIDAGLYMDFEVTSFQNGRYANLFGLELNAQTRLKFLPGFFKYLTLIGNYSFTRSEATPGTGISFRLPGQAQSFGNIILSYDRNGFSAGMALNYTDEYTFSVGDTREEDHLFDGRYQLDFNISKEIGKNFRVYGEAINITDQPLRGLYGNNSRVSELEIYSWWCRVGVGWKF